MAQRPLSGQLVRGINMIDMTDAQKHSIEILHQWHEIEQPLHEFMASAYEQIGFNDGSLMIEAKGIWYGIEADGSRHT